MGVNVLACGQCGAGLLPPDDRGSSACVYCGTEHQTTRSSDVLRAARARSDRPSWHDCADATCIPLTDEAVLGLLRQHFVHTDGIFVCPHVPPATEQDARRLHAEHLPSHERVLALYDASGFSSTEGFVVTARRVCWRNRGEGAATLEWADLSAEDLFIDGNRLFVGQHAIRIDEEAILASAFDAFHVMALSAVPVATTSGLVLRERPPSSWPLSSRNGAEATPPPPHTTSFLQYAKHATKQRPDCSCWRCQTPLYAATPQCAYCGAAPLKTGWKRTG